MKTIPESVYQTLTPAERISAAISADARGDQEELRRLVSTCAKKTYVQTDAAFKDVMDRIMSVSMAREVDLLRNCLHIATHTMGIVGRAGKEPSSQEVVERSFVIDDLNATVSTIERAWEMFADYLGVPFEELMKATAPRDELTAFWVRECCKEPADEEAAAELFAHIKQLVFT